MRKVASVFSIVFGLTLLVASTSREAMTWIVEKRQTGAGTWWGEHWRQDAGDLANMAFLENMPAFRDTNIHNYVRAEKGAQRTNLYLWGDSYVKDIPDSVFYGLHTFHFGRRDYTDLNYELDTARNNILIIAYGERFLRSRFRPGTDIFQHLKKANTATPAITFLPFHTQPGYAFLGLPGIKANDFFNPLINQNIEYNLFNYNIFNSTRNLKAELNAVVFGRGSGDVVISENGARLFLKGTVAPRGFESSYEPITERDKAILIESINSVYDHYRKEGFSQVYLSIIPNPATILQPREYNGVLPYINSLRREGKLRMPLIDIYEEMSRSSGPDTFYQHGDSHWSDAGIQLWLGRVNAVLKAWEQNAETHIGKGGSKFVL